MSLIGDALRKARQEAADRETDRRGILFSAKIADSHSRSNLGLGLALGALIAVIATVAGGVAVWWLLGNGESPPPELSGAAAPVATEIAEPSGSQVESLIPLPTRGESATPTPSATAIPPTSETEPVPRHTRPSTTEEQATAGGEDDFSSWGFIGTEDGNDVYILEADLGNVRLSLDFIVFRADDSFAEINGVELHVGGVIEGYRVKEIERDRVLLSDGRRSVVLRAP